MRILMTTDTIGGVWTFTKELSTELLSHGCAVALVSFGRMPSVTQRKWVADQAERWGSNFYFAASDAPLEWMDDNSGALPKGAPVLSRVAESFEAELLLSSQYCFGALECDLARILIAHSDVLSWAVSCRGRELERSVWLDNYCRLVADGLGCADAVVAPTRWMLEALASHFSLPTDARVIKNGRSIEPSVTGTHRKCQGVSVGRLWDEGKNLKVLSEIRLPIPIVVAGETYHESAHFSLTGGDLRLLGPLAEDEVLALFRSSSIYICTSQYEPFGYAPLEAALCGCAVVANDLPSLREVWGDAALYFADPERLSGLLADLTRDRNLLMVARKKARARARDLSRKSMGREYLKMCEGLLHRVPARQYVA